MNLTNGSAVVEAPTLTTRVVRLLGLVGVFVVGLLALNLIPQLGFYVLELPVYYHVLLFVALGVWSWASNIHVLTSFGIDCNALLGLHSNADQILPVASPVGPSVGGAAGFLQSHARDFITTYQMAFLFTAFVLSSIGFYEFWVVRYSGAIVIPSVTYGLLLLSLVIPGGSRNTLYWSERKRFLQILGDLHTTFADLVWVPGGLLHLPTGGLHSISPYITPMLVATPFLIRLRQCASEYLLSKDPAAKRRHLLNAIKYSSSFPVIIASTVVTNIQRMVLTHVVQDPDLLVQLGGRAQTAMRLWVMFSVIHAVYSLYWDFVYDWDLGYVSGNFIHQLMSGGMGRGARNAKQRLRYPLLREHLYFPSPLVYYLAMLLDAGCRFSWFFKVVPVYRSLKMELATDSDLSVGHIHRPTEEFIALDLTLKLLELFRRWVWVFFRVEKEWVATRVRRPMLQDSHERIKSSNDGVVRMSVAEQHVGARHRVEK